MSGSGELQKGVDSYKAYPHYCEETLTTGMAFCGIHVPQQLDYLTWLALLLLVLFLSGTSFLLITLIP